MSSLTENVQGYHALASITGGEAPAYSRQRGFVGSPLRNGAGDLTLELKEAIDLAGGNGVCLFGLNGSTSGTITVEVVDATHLRVRTASGEGPTDMSLWLALQPIGPN